MSYWTESAFKKLNTYAVLLSVAFDQHLICKGDLQKKEIVSGGDLLTNWTKFNLVILTITIMWRFFFSFSCLFSLVEDAIYVAFIIHCQYLTFWVQGFSQGVSLFTIFPCWRGLGWGAGAEEGWGFTVCPVNSHHSIWKLVAGSVLVAALLPWSLSGPFYSRQMHSRWWGPRYVRHTAPIFLFMWICLHSNENVSAMPVCLSTELMGW